MSICSDGHESPDGASFCIMCGQPLVVTAGAGSMCSNKHENPEGAAFCNSCGEPSTGRGSRPQPESLAPNAALEPSVSSLPPPPTSTSVRRVTEQNAPGHAQSVGLAIILLAAAVVAAIWLIVGAPDTGGHDPSEIDPVAGLEFYGGDAYTGIQNAAAYTEVAVAESGNALAELNADIADDNAEQWKHLYNGLAALLVLVAGANVTLALRRT